MTGLKGASKDTDAATPEQQIAAGRAVLGVELGSTRIKACLVGDDPSVVLAAGTHDWENAYIDGRWTYPLDVVWHGLQAAFADLAVRVREQYGVELRTLRAIGVSAMMHGYLALDDAGELLVPFRTWRNTSTGPAADELTELFGVNIPLRWSIAHLHQAFLDEEPHVPRIAHFTTLAGLVHERLTGRRVLGIGDASGMFPIDSTTGTYDAAMLERYDALRQATAAGRIPPLVQLLPEVLAAGSDAGTLTPEGAVLLDPTGTLHAGAIACPPEGDAGTGMVATNAISPRTGNVSAGTSTFAMVVLERRLQGVHPEIDLVTTPAGDPVAMVHCNNGASELAAWVAVFTRFAAAIGSDADSDTVYDVLFREALSGEKDAGGILAYNHISGEPIAGVADGRPLVVRTPDSELTLANLMRAHLHGVFATLVIGMRTLAEQGVGLDRMNAHGGLFRTAGVAQRVLAAALDTPVAVGSAASEGGAWGIAVLASFTADVAEGDNADLTGYLDHRVFAGASTAIVQPNLEDADGFAAYLATYHAGLAAERAAAPIERIRP